VVTTLALLGAWMSAPARADEPSPVGVVLALGGADVEVALASAVEAGGARWRSEVLPPPTAPEGSPDVSFFETAYVEGDFARCVAALQRPETDLDALLAAGRLDAAATVGWLGAACAHGGGDLELTATIVDRALAAGLDRGPLHVTTPAFRAFVETREAARGDSTVVLRLVSNPAGARAEVDGREGCEATPCDLRLRMGDHLLRLWRLGNRPRQLRLALRHDETERLTLDPAPAALLRAQLAVATSAERPDHAAIADGAADGFGARVVLIVHPESGGFVAAVWDRGLRRFAARVRASSIEDATRLAVREWRGVVEPTPLRRQPLFWTLLVAGAGVAAVLVWVFVRPPERTFAIEVF
jgi:hypothetical protein